MCMGWIAGYSRAGQWHYTALLPHIRVSPHTSLHRAQGSGAKFSLSFAGTDMQNRLNEIRDMTTEKTFELLVPTSTTDLESIRTLFLEYAQSLAIDLCFQNFQEELRTLPGEYAPPRGGLLLATVNGLLAGCCAMRPLDSVDYPNACEMKRLYVRNDYRGMRLGRLLAEKILDMARLSGYDCILLDTLDEMESARALYQELGFEEIPPYYFNPIAGAHYLKANL